MRTRKQISGVLAIRLVAMMCMLMAISAKAATISWSVVNITNDVTQISTNGTAVEAHGGADGGSTANVVDGGTFTINGVTFDDGFVGDSPTHLDTINARAGSGMGGNYYTLLRFADRQSSGTATFTFTNLIRNAQYEIQVWHSDNVSTVQDNGIVLNDGGTSSVPTPGAVGHVTVLSEVVDTGPGQYALGTFTANSSAQQFLAKAYGSLLTTPVAQANVTINGVQLRLTYTPPSGTVLIVR